MIAFTLCDVLYLSLSIHIAPVAQLDRVPGYEPGGREFESLRARHLFFRSIACDRRRMLFRVRRYRPLHLT